MYYAKPLARLIGELEKLPSVGPKTAQRLAFHVLRNPNDARLLADAIATVGEQISHCSVCFNFTDQEVCDICRGDRRDHALLCVVAEPSDLIAIEKTNEYRGLYHVMGGLISPQDGVGEDMLRMRELIERVGRGEFTELILALKPSLEGETTGFVIQRRLQPFAVPITKIAFGLPVGGDLDIADVATLAQALQGRRKL
jgi:recombination protein RecR